MNLFFLTSRARRVATCHFQIFQEVFPPLILSLDSFTKGKTPYLVIAEEAITIPQISIEFVCILRLPEEYVSGHIHNNSVMTSSMSENRNISVHVIILSNQKHIKLKRIDSCTRKTNVSSRLMLPDLKICAILTCQ